MTLAGASKIRVSRRIVDETAAALQRAGRKGDELFVFWSGVVVQEVCQVQHLLCPRQTCVRGRRGLSVDIDGDALHAQSVWLGSKRQTLAVQIHSHPEEAYLSDADERLAVVTLTGAVSIVVPRFASGGLFAGGSRYYRLGDEGWNELGAWNVVALLEVT